MEYVGIKSQGELWERRRRGIFVARPVWRMFQSSVRSDIVACGAALTGLVNSFVRVTQGVALGYPLAPRWGCEWWSRLRRWPTRLRQTDWGYPYGIKSFSPALPMESATPGQGPEMGSTLQGSRFQNLVAAEVTRLKHSENQSLLTSAATALKEPHR